MRRSKLVNDWPSVTVELIFVLLLMEDESDAQPLHRIPNDGDIEPRIDQFDQEELDPLPG